MARPKINQTRAERLARVAAAQAHLAAHNLTTMRDAHAATARVHLGFETGVYDMGPLCGALEGREIETIDEVSRCGDCAQVARLMGLEWLIKDADGWTGIYLPRGHSGLLP